MKFLKRLGGRASGPAWLVLVIALLLTVLAWYGTKEQAMENARQQFDLNAKDVTNAIQERMRQHEQILLGAAGLFDANGDVTRAEWRRYVERLNLAKNYPGIQGVGFSQLIEPHELAAHTATIRAQGFSLYTVRPPGERDLYTSIIYLEPFEGRNLAAFGFDMMSETTRALAMRAAAESGQTIISGKVRLVQETHGKPQAGFLMYVPVYRAGQPLGTPRERWADLRGFVYSPYRMNDLMYGVLGERLPTVDFKIYDGAAALEDRLMYDSRDDEVESAREGAPMLQEQRTIRAYGEHWTLKLASRPEFEERFQGAALGWLVLGLGGGISLLLFLLIATLSSRSRQTEATLAAIVRAIDQSQMVAEFNLYGTVLAANDNFLRALGYQRDEVLGMSHAIFVEPAQVASDAYRVFWTELNRGHSQSGEFKRIGKDGREVWIQATYAPIRDADGRVTKVMKFATDVTDEVTAKLLIQDMQTRTRAILDAVSDGVITMDAQGRVETFNPAAQHIFGYAEVEVVGDNITVLVPGLDWSNARMLGVEHEATGRRKDGADFPMELMVRAMTVAGRRMFTCTLRDITERKRVEKMKSEFISTVSHELRTPLTSIRGSLGLITGGALGGMSEQAGAMLKIASNNTERLLLLINDILDIQKIESGQMVFRFQDLAVSPFLRDVLRDLSSYGDQYDVRFVIAREAAGASVYADRDRLTQVMANLLSNAAKFSPAGTQVEISTAYHGDFLRIAVADHGPGIPEDFQPRLFEHFTQADSSDTRSKGGTGLGLAITKAIVEKHGGQIGFVTQAGVGTTFHVELPLIASSKGKDLPRERDKAAPQAPRRILVVEDDPDVAALIQRMLADAGIESDVAYDAAQARALLARNRDAYGLMTLDIILPGEDGMSLLSSLRENDSTRDLPVVVLSVKADEARQQLNGGAVGVLDWLHKPIDQARLVAVARAAAQGGRPARILHVEDDPDVQQVVRAMLQGQCELVTVATLEAARRQLGQQTFNLVLLDIGLPDGSGLCLLDAVNQHVHPPKVVIFSAQDVSPQDADKVSAVLVKSRTDNEALVKVLTGLMNA